MSRARSLSATRTTRVVQVSVPRNQKPIRVSGTKAMCSMRESLIHPPGLAYAGGGAGRLAREGPVRVEARAGVEVPGVARGKAGAEVLSVHPFRPGAFRQRGDPHARTLGLDEMDVARAFAHEHRAAAGLAARQHLGRIG